MKGLPERSISYTSHSKARSRVWLEPTLKEAWPQGYPMAAICVQRFDDSLNSAIRITYRISLRSSSLLEPRYPLSRVVQRFVFFLVRKSSITKNVSTKLRKGVKYKKKSPIDGKTSQSKQTVLSYAKPSNGLHYSAQRVDTWIRVNDPSAGSPTETLLRLLLPLNDQVWSTSRIVAGETPHNKTIHRAH